MARNLQQPSYTDCVYQVMATARQPLSLSEIVSRVNDIRKLTAKQPESTVRSALSKSYLIRRVDYNLYAYMPGILKDNRFRHVLTQTELETGEVAVDYDLLYALWPSRREAKKRRTEGQVTLHLHKGEAITAYLEQFDDGTWGIAENQVIRQWLEERKCKVGDELIFEVLDAEEQEYNVKKDKKRKNKKIRRRNQEIADAAWGLVEDSFRGMIISDIAVSLVAENLYADKIPPDPITFILDEDERFFIDDEWGLIYLASSVGYDDELVRRLGDMVLDFFPETSDQLNESEITELLRDMLDHPEKYPIPFDLPPLADQSFGPLDAFAFDEWDDNWDDGLYDEDWDEAYWAEEDGYLEGVEQGQILPFDRTALTTNSGANRAELSEADLHDIFQQLMDETTRQDEARLSIEKLKMYRRQVIPRLVEMLRSPSKKERQMATLTLIELDDQAVIPALSKILHDNSANDAVKFAVISTLIGLGADLSPDEMLAQLRDPVQTMRQSMDEMLARMDREAERANFLANLQNYPTEIMEGIIADIGASGHSHALYILNPLLHYSDEEIVLTVIAALDNLKNPAAIPALQELVNYDFAPDVISEARRVVGRLTMRASVQEDLTGTETTEHELNPLHGVWVSTIDGNGSQLAMVTREQPNNYLQILNVMFNDYQGIKDCFGADLLEEEELDDIFDQAETSGISMVKVSLAACQHFLHKARQINLEEGYLIPLEYEAWKSFLGTSQHKEIVEPAPIGVDIDEQPELFEECARLLELRQFSSWFFDPLIWLDYEAARSALRRARGREKERRRAEIIRRGLSDIIDYDFRRLLRERLRHQAWVLKRLYEDEKISKWAMAAAVGLDPRLGIPLHEHPLLRGMMEITLQAPPNVPHCQLPW